ncbi:MAG: RNA methyltransferase, partial [Altibacter sp.]|nr:RNA methyltransferase [Altibacter sp.]
MEKTISSLQNPLVKQILQLSEKSRERKKTGLFIIEGQREIHLAIKGGYFLKTVLFCSDIISEEDLYVIKEMSNSKAEFIEITIDVYQKLAYRSSTEGILAIAEARSLSLERLSFTSKHPLILVAEATEKPGNIGALLRTADAARLDAVIIANPRTDMYNPNIIRSSVGCLFTNPVATGSTTEILQFLKDKNI